MKENTNTVLKNQADNDGRFDAFVTPTLNTFYNDDCMNWLPKCPPNFFELAIVDPPYGLGKRIVEGGSVSPFIKEQKENVKIWDVSPPPPEYFEQLFRVSKNQIIWGGNYFGLPKHRCFIVWDKTIHGNTYSDAELAWTSFDSPARIYAENIAIITSEGRIHPTQKSTKMYKWILRNFTAAGDKILDTHAGSASCLVACKEMGFDYVGFEIDKDYWTIANERLGRAYYQPELFGRSG